MMQQYHHTLVNTRANTIEATVTNFLTTSFIMIYENIFFSARFVNIWNNFTAKFCCKRKHG